MSPDRYEGRPMLRLVDSYAFWAIGELAPEDEQRLEAMTPRLREVYGSTGTWQQIVTEQMEYPEDLPARLREMWESNLRIAAERDEVLPPAVFVEQVVDSSLIS